MTYVFSIPSWESRNQSRGGMQRRKSMALDGVIPDSQKALPFKFSENACVGC